MGFGYLVQRRFLIIITIKDYDDKSMVMSL